MVMERQQVRSFHQILPKRSDGNLCHAIPQGSGTVTGAIMESQMKSATSSNPALANRLLNEVCHQDNLKRACDRVIKNRGKPGIDGMTVDDLATWFPKHWEELSASVMNGSYRPQPVRGVRIPKPGGGIRQLGIPTVKDRLVQQAILQVLYPIIDAGFSDSSYGFRTKRNAHLALKRAKKIVAAGRNIVVDLDLEKFFDKVNHDIIMNRLAIHVSNKCLYDLIRLFLKAGMIQDGILIRNKEGTPQGGPLSPLLANLILDDLDKKLEKDKHLFCRYADDCNIFVKSVRAGERVMQSITKFLESKLKLTVNKTKSAVAPTEERKFLGYRVLNNGRLSIAPQSITRLKISIRKILHTNRNSLDLAISELNRRMKSWWAYFRFGANKAHLRSIDGWVRRKLRSLMLKQCQTTEEMITLLSRHGVSPRLARFTATSGQKAWALSGTITASRAMPTRWFEDMGLENLVQKYDLLQSRLAEIRKRTDPVI